MLATEGEDATWSRRLWRNTGHRAGCRKTTRARDECCRRTWTTARDAAEGEGSAGGVDEGAEAGAGVSEGGDTAGTPTTTQECGAILGDPGGWGGGRGGTKHTRESKRHVVTVTTEVESDAYHVDDEAGERQRG